MRKLSNDQPRHSFRMPVDQVIRGITYEPSYKPHAILERLA